MKTTAYDTAAILRQNVADLERELQRQRERADKAEAELKAAREQEPVLWRVNGNYFRDSDSAILFKSMNTMFDFKIEPLYTSPITAHAPVVQDDQFRGVTKMVVPDGWREVMAELAADLQACIEAEHAYRDQYSSIMRKYQNDMQIVERARALLQSAEVVNEND